MTKTPGICVSPPKYYPAIDGLRAVAVLMVFSAHYLSDFRLIDRVVSWGWAGVDIFFVLSGFLITGILIDTRERGNFFRSFYLRRSLRIFPLFYGVWAAILVLGLFGHPLYNRYNLFVALYLENFFGVTHPQGCTIQILFAGKKLLIGLGHFWTLGLEEQFYLLWPLTVWFVRDRRRLGQLCVVICIAVLLLRTYLRLHLPPALANSDFLYNQSYTRMDALLIGAWLSLWVRRPDVGRERIQRLGQRLLAGALTVLIIGEVITSHYWRVYCDDPFCSSVGFTLVDLAAAGLLLLTITPGSLAYRALVHRRLVSLGRISYGFYVFHALPVYVLFGVEIALSRRHLGFIVPLFAFVYSYGAAYLSYRYWESPFLRWKDRFSAARTIPVHPSGEPYPTRP